MAKKILFRADSSFLIGTGHIMRDLVLAKQYSKAGNEILFATQNLEGNINYKIEEQNYVVKNLLTSNTKELIELINQENIDLLVIDNYDIDFNDEKKIKKQTGVKILCFDDTYLKHHCDFLLNHNIYANKKRYHNLVPANCKLYCGTKYTLLRDEFIQEKKKKTIFLAMGGADSANLNIPILRILQKYKNIKVYLLTTSANKNLKTLKNYVKNYNWIKLKIDSHKMAKLMKKSDFAITTPSVTLNELYFMNIPFITIKIAPNQNEMYNFLQKKKLPTLEKFDKRILHKEIKKFIRV